MTKYYKTSKYVWGIQHRYGYGDNWLSWKKAQIIQNLGETIRDKRAEIVKKYNAMEKM